MKLTEKLIEMSEDALARLQKRMGKLDDYETVFVVGEQTIEGEAEGAIQIQADLRKQIKDANAVIATTDSATGSLGDDDSDETIETNYYVFSTKEDAKSVERILSDLMKKHKYFYASIGKKEFKA